MLKNLGWESYISVVEDSNYVTNLLDTLVESSDGQICLIEKPIVLPKLSENGYTNVYKEIMECTLYFNIKVKNIFNTSVICYN